MTLRKIELDLFAPASRGTVTGTSGVWMSENLNERNPDWVQVVTPDAFLAATGYTLVEVSDVRYAKTKKGCLFVRALSASGLQWIGRTLDLGANWDWVQAGTTSAGTPVGFSVMDTDSNKVFVSGVSGELYVSLDALTTFTFSVVWTDTTFNAPIPNIEARNGKVYIAGGQRVPGSGDGGYAWGSVVGTVTIDYTFTNTDGDNTQMYTQAINGSTAYAAFNGWSLYANPFDWLGPSAHMEYAGPGADFSSFPQEIVPSTPYANYILCRVSSGTSFSISYYAWTDYYVGGWPVFGKLVYTDCGSMTLHLNPPDNPLGLGVGVGVNLTVTLDLDYAPPGAQLLAELGLYVGTKSIVIPPEYDGWAISSLTLASDHILQYGGLSGLHRQAILTEDAGQYYRQEYNYTPSSPDLYPYLKVSANDGATFADLGDIYTNEYGLVLNSDTLRASPTTVDTLLGVANYGRMALTTDAGASWTHPASGVNSGMNATAHSLRIWPYNSQRAYWLSSGRANRMLGGDPRPVVNCIGDFIDRYGTPSQRGSLAVVWRR